MAKATAKPTRRTNAPGGGRPTVDRTNKIEPIGIKNINILDSDLIDVPTLQDSILKTGVISPLEFLVAVYMNDSVDTKLRVDAAKTATAYFHKKLPVAIEHTGKDGRDLQIINVQQAARTKLLDFLDVVELLDDDGTEHTVINGETIDEQ